MKLKYLQELIEDLNTTNSKNDKLVALKKHHIINPIEYKQWMNVIFHYDINYNITSKVLKKRKDLIEECEYTLPQLLNALNNRTITGYKAISLTNGFIEQNSQYEDLLYKIIDKKLDGNISVKSVNKAVPNTVPVFEVALANKYDSNKHNIDDYFISRKLDGIRCIIKVDVNGHACAYSRQGKEITTIQKILDDIELLNLTNVIFDGEICLIDENGNESFQCIMKEIKRKDYTIENPMYKIFDFLSVDEFESGSTKDKLIDRINQVENILNTINKSIKHLSIVEQKTIDQFDSMIEEANNNGWEGLILRKNAPYKSGRSDDLLKVKKMHDAEYVVKYIEEDIFPVLENGQYIKKPAVGALVIEHRGNKVNVGSGMSVEQRLAWKENPDSIIGKVITVQYFEETQNQNGGYSLRFPVLKIVHGNKREI